MEKIESRKKLEKFKAILQFIMFIGVLLIPTTLQTFSGKKELIALLAITLVITVIYFKVRKLKYKLESLDV